MQKTNEVTRFHAREAVESQDWAYKTAGIVFSASVAAGFWTWIISLTGSALGQQPELATLESAAIAIAAIVTIALVALPSAE